MRGIGTYQIKQKIEMIQKELAVLKGMVTKFENELGPTEQGDGAPKQIVATYCEEWKKRYKSNPTMGGKDIGSLQRLLKDHGLPRAQILVTAYLKMSESFFIRKRHNVMTLSQNIASVGHFADSGQLVTNGSAKSMERAAEYGDLMHQVEMQEL